MLQGETLQRFVSQHKERLSFDTWASIEHNFFFFHTPKAGCTKIKKMLQYHCGYEAPDDVSSVHQRKEGIFVKSLIDFSPSGQEYLMNSRDVVRFCFTRNPYTRLLSSFNSKIIGPKKYGDIQERIQRKRVNVSTDLPSFREFIDFISPVPDHNRDIHWRSQHLILHYDKINYTFTGRFETFYKDLILVFTLLGAKPEVFSLIPKVENPSTGLDFHTAYNESDVIEKVFNLYEIDFNAFHYKKDIPCHEDKIAGNS